MEDAGEPGTSNEQNQSLKRKERDEKNDPTETATKKQKIDFPRCPICLKKMKHLDELTSTPCAHVFCTLCLHTSYEYSKTCPLCRLPVEEDNESTGQEKGDGEEEEYEPTQEELEVDEDEEAGGDEEVED